MITLPRILLIEDEPEIRTFLETVLADNYQIKTSANGKDGLKQLTRQLPDLVLLDLGLPDMDGKDIIAEIRALSQLPIIILSARHAETEKVLALEAGADDYLTKPFGAAELLVRIKVALRHVNRIANDDVIYQHNDLSVDLNQRRVLLSGQVVALTPTEYALLVCLVRKAGQIITQSELLKTVWGKSGTQNSHYLRIYVQHLRQKLHDDPLAPLYIFTEPGIGYRFAAP